MKIVFCDLDGVITNFVDCFCKLVGERGEDVIARLPPGEWEFHKHLSKPLTRLDFLATVAKAGEPFWSTMEAYPHARGLYDNLCRIKGCQVHFCTTPTPDAGSHAGKRRWIARWVNCQNFDNYVFTRHKHLLASPGRLLIDDSDFNVNAFRSAGGDAILFPQPWNSRWREANHSVEYILEDVEEWASE